MGKKNICGCFFPTTLSFLEEYLWLFLPHYLIIFSVSGFSTQGLKTMARKRDKKGGGDEA